MLRLEAGICPLRNCGTCGKFGQSPILGNIRLACGSYCYVLCDDLGIGPAVQLPVTSNHAASSVLLTMSAGSSIRCHRLTYLALIAMNQ